MTAKTVVKLLMVVLCLALSIGMIQAQDTLDCENDIIEIWQIQGTGDEAQCLGETIITENNIVSGAVRTEPTAIHNAMLFCEPGASNAIAPITSKPGAPRMHKP